MDSGTVVGLALLVIGVLTLVLLGAAEAGVIAGVRERVLREPTETPEESLRRFYQERQLTLSSLALARNLASVGVTVDSYVVYFERLKDEVRSGRTLRSSTERAFARAFRTILDAHVTTLISAALIASRQLLASSAVFTRMPFLPKRARKLWESLGLKK